MEQEQLSLNDFVIQNKIGSGSFGKVYKVKAKKNNEIYAAKISHEELEDSPEMNHDISCEVSILSKLNHPSVLKFIYFSPINFKKKFKPVIITEYASNGTLEDFIRERKRPKDPNLNNDKPPQKIQGTQSNLKQEKVEEEKEQNSTSNFDSETQSNVNQEKIEEKKVQSKSSNLNSNSETQSNLKQEKVEEEKEQLSTSIFNSETQSNLNQEKIEEKKVQSEVSNNDKTSNLIILDSLSDPRLDEIFKEAFIQSDESESSIPGDFLTEKYQQDEYDFDETRKLIVIYGIASAMAYLHKHDIIHRDLKPANILMDDFLFPKIADFGLSKITTIEKVDSILKSTEGSIKGTPIYMAPEIWQKLEYSKASDVYAFGLILYELYTQNKPFNNCKVFQIPLMLLKKYRPSFNEDIPQIYKDLIIRCWSDDPKQRPTFEQIVDELKNNEEYITSKVNKKEFLIYVNYIEEQQSSFEMSKNVDLESIFGQFKIVQQESFKKRKLLLLFFPYEMFIKLKNKESINLVLEARNDSNKLFRLAQCVIEGESDFPRNIQLGIKYLRNLIDTNDINACKEALIYYIRILIKGSIVPFNEKLVNKLLEKFFINDKSIYYLFKGKLSKKKGNYKQAQEFFDISIKDKNLESAYEYCKILLMNTLSKEEEDYLINLLKKLISLNFIPASYLYGKYLLNRNQENDLIEATRNILHAANNGHIKSCYIIGNTLYKQKRIDESIQYYKTAANKGHINSLITLAAIIKNDEGMSLFKKAADKGSVQSIYLYGCNLKDRQERARYVKIAADNGYTSAMVIYGRMLRLGDGVPTDSNEAIRYYKMAIDQGNTIAMTQYAHMLKHGDGIPANPTEASKYYKMAIEKGNSSAMNDYGHMLKNGIGVEKNYEEAIKYYKMAIEKGEPAAANNYGYMLFSGEGIEKNYEEAIKYFKISINGGYPEAMHTYAIMLMKGIGVEKNYEEAIKYLKMAINKGLAKAMNTYALMLKQGDGVSVNYHEAAKYYKMAIQKGNAAAMYNYAKMLQKGNGISINLSDAIKYYKMAAANGYPIAMYDLGSIYLNGNGVEVNYEEAAKYFKNAVRYGNVDSMLSYASMLVNGQGCQPNPEEAIKYYRLAINKGSGEAMYQYGLMLHKGNGVKQNIEEAIKYYQLAYQHGEYKGFLALTFIQMGADIMTDE